MDFSKKSTGIYLSLGVTKWGAWKFLAVTTAILFVGLGIQYAQEHFPGYEIATATIAGILGWVTVDFGLGPMVAYYFDNKGSTDGDGDGRARSTLFNMILIFVLVRSLASMTISFWSAGEVAEMATSKVDSEFFINAIERQDSSKLAAMATAKASYDKLSQNESKRVREAKKKGHEAVLDAIRMGDKWQRRSYEQNHFSWIDSPKNPDKKDKKYAASIRQARADSAAWVQAEYDRTTTAESAYNGLISDKSTETAKTTILKMSNDEGIAYQETKARRTTLLIFADIFFGILGWLCEYVQALMRKAGVTVERKRTFAYVMRQILNSWAEWFLSLLEKLIAVDIDGNGEIGTVGKKKKSSPTLPEPDPTIVTTITEPDEWSEFWGRKPATTGTKMEATTPDRATTERSVVRGFRPATDDDATTTPPTTTPLHTVAEKPPTPVATGVSAGLTTPAATVKPTPEKVTVVVMDGRKFVVHNGKERGLDWVTKTRAVYVGRLKDYKRKKKDTANVEANLALFDEYIVRLTAGD